MQTPLPSFLSREQVFELTGSAERDDSVDVKAQLWDKNATSERWIVTATQHSVHAAVLNVSLAGDKSTPAIERVAYTRGSSTPAADWNPMPYPFGSNRGIERLPTLAENTRLVAIDVAPYRMNETERLFGLRFDQFTKAMRTIVDNEELTLVRIVGDELRPVLDVPISARISWFLLGTFYTMNLVVHVDDVKTNGVFDLLLRNPASREQLRWKWNSARGVYDCAD